MLDYAQNFIESSTQFIALGCVGLVWAGFTVIGGAFGGSNRLREIDHLIGWAVFSFLFTGLGVFTSLTFPVLATGAGVVGLCALMIVLRRDGGFGSSTLLRVLVLATPLILLAAAMKGSQWDEFTDWLVIPRYMLETGAFPSHENPYTNSTFSGYPYSWHYLTYLSSLLAGQLLESAGGLSNVFLLLASSVLLVRLIGMAIDDDDLHKRPPWALCAFAALATTLINPTFAQKVVLTSYADTASAVVSGVAMIIAWFCIEALIAGKARAARRYAVSLGLLLLLLVNLKQATLVLAILIAGGFYIIALRDSAVRFVDALKLGVYIFLPPTLMYLTWRYHLHADTATVRELSVSPLSEWLIHLIPDILGRMGLILTKKGYYLALLVILIGVGLRGFWRSRTPFDRFAALAMGIVVGYNVFLLFAYVTTFGEDDALRAASYWRYSMHLGLIIVAFSVFGLARVWHERFRGQINFSRLKWVAMALIIAAPFVFAKKLRFDRAPMTAHFRVVGAAVSRLLIATDAIFVADPRGSGESAAILGFELRTKARLASFISAFSGDRLTPVKKAHENKDVSAMLIYSTLPEYDALFGHQLKASQSYLFKRKVDGTWQVVQTWRQPPH